MANTILLELGQNILPVNRISGYLKTGGVESEDIQPYRIQDFLYSDWLFYVLLFIVLIFVIIRFFFLKDFSAYLKAFKSLNIARQLCREQELSIPISAVLLNTQFILVFSVFSYFYVVYNKIDLRYSGYQLFIFFIILFGTVYLMKYGVAKIVGFFFPLEKTIELYSFFTFLNLKIAGVVLLPIIFIFCYVSFKSLLIYITLLLLFAFVLNIIIQGGIIGREYLLKDKFHFFLYICTLEIAPFMLLVKLLKHYIIV